MLVLLAVPATAGAAASWQSGPLTESQDENCITGDIEYEAGTYMSYYADPSNPPKVGDTFYVAIDVTGIGNTCAGIYADVNLVLPQALSLAIDSTHPVYCYLGFPGHSTFSRDTQDCPQSLPAGIHGYSLDPVGVNPPFYPLPQGGTAEIQVPVKSSVPGTVQFGGYVELADGEFDPVLGPTMYAIVNPAAVQQTGRIGVFYQTPSISGQSQSGLPVSATYTAYVQNNSNPGYAVAQYAKADAAGDCTSPTLVYTTPSAPLQNPQTQITGNFTGMYPGGAYCWRIVATVTSGAQAGEYDGNWEYFATIGTYTSQFPTDPNKPPPAHALTGTQCSSNGSGCQTSNCDTSNCTSTGSLSGLGHTVAILLGGTGTGKVTGPDGISCPGTCSRVYTAGTTGTVTLTAAADPGSTFTGWSGGGCSGTSTCVVSSAADQNVTATFTKNAPPPSAPKCTLSAVSNKVLLRKPRHGHPAIGPGLLAFKAGCDQNASLRLTATLTETFKRHGRKVTKTFRLGPAAGSATAGRSTQLALKLPRAALTALAQHLHESVAATLTASNANGSSTPTASVPKLVGRQP